MKQLAVFVVLLFAPGCVSPPEYREFAQRLSPSVVALQDETGRTFCSGFAITTTQIITNRHCTELRILKQVKLHDGRLLDVALVGESKNVDVALIEVREAVLVPVVLGNDAETQIGDFVVAIGHPFGKEWSMTTGYVANINMEEPDFTPGQFFEVTALINPGNSGGPLFNASGEVIGINTWGINGSGLGFSLEIGWVMAEIALITGV